MATQKSNVFKANATALGDMAKPLRDAATKLLESATRVHDTVCGFDGKARPKTLPMGVQILS